MIEYLTVMEVMPPRKPDNKFIMLRTNHPTIPFALVFDTRFNPEPGVPHPFKLKVEAYEGRFRHYWVPFTKFSSPIPVNDYPFIKLPSQEYLKAMGYEDEP